MTRNNELESAYCKLAERALQIMLKHIPEYIPSYPSSKFQHQLKKLRLMNSHNTMAEVLFQNLLLEKKSEVESLTEFSNFFEIMNKDNQLSKFVKKSVSLWGVTLFGKNFNYLYNSLSRIIMSSYESNAFDRESALEEYRYLESFFYDDFVSIQVLIPVYNLIASEEIDLGRLVPYNWKFTVRVASNQELNNLALIVEGDFLRRSLIMESKYLLELYFSEKLSFGEEESQDSTQEVKKVLENIITSFRLLKSGNIYCGIVYFKPKFGTTSKYIFPDFDYAAMIFNTPYIFEKKDIEECDVIMDSLSSLNEHSRRAVDRFDLAYSRTELSDKLIDLMIAYESLFSGEITDSVSHKLALRFSRLTSTDSAIRKQNYTRMKELYKERNKVVHAGKKEIDFGIVSETEEFLRTSLKNYLLKIKQFSNDHMKLLDSLDFN
jgi:hypothetical protein